MEHALPATEPSPAYLKSKRRGRWLFRILAALVLFQAIVPGWENVFRRLNGGSELDWQGQKIQLPFNWAIRPNASSPWGNITLESYRLVWIPFVNSGPKASNVTLFPPPTAYTASRSLAYQGSLAQKGSYSGYIPTARPGEYSCIAKTTQTPRYMGASTQLFDLQCFQQEKGWSFVYFGSQELVDQVFAMLAPANADAVKAK
jgi:hypothetical protein